MPPKRKIRKKKDAASKRGEVPSASAEDESVEPLAKRSKVLSSPTCSSIALCISEVQ